MTKAVLVQLFFIFAMKISAHAQQGATPEFLNQTFVGYQGWFTTAHLSTNNLWHHWSSGSPPSPGNITFELYPDVREYAATDLIDTNLGPLGNGQPSRLYAGDRLGVIDTHFRWMRQYGIDGIALQRFVSELGSPEQRTVRNHVAQMVRASSEKWGKSFYMEYDITSSNPETFVDVIKNDWQSTLEPMLVGSQRYARHHGHPVIAIWGLGFTDRPGTQAQAQDLIQWFHSKGYFVIGGIPYWWRQEVNDSRRGWLSTYMQFDMLQPWAVGRYNNTDELATQFEKIQIADKKLCDQNHRYYQRVIFPGFSWSNWNGGPYNHIPRRGGDFLWKQAWLVKKLGATALVAMFDEYDEGTAIAKAAENHFMTPVNQNFLTLDADGFNISSDFYLRLTGEATKLLRGPRWFSGYNANVPIPYR